MPNHITTVLTACPEALTHLRSDDSEVDFNEVISQPANIEIGGCNGRHAPEVICWYSWNVENWGTKWNAYDISRENDTIKFHTAWGHPFPVIKELSLLYPTDVMLVKYADEDLGSNLGDYAILDGNVFFSYKFIERSEEALDFAARLCFNKPYEDMDKD